MEETARDHGIDRLLIIFLFFLFSFSANATTFGPINVSDQIRRSQYFLHGTIVEGPWTEMERQVNQPFSFWKLLIIEQFNGPALAKEIVIRQPGGEINGLGYRVAGSATFSKGEEVFVTVRDTTESSVKEVVGLASGKYKIMNNGAKIENGIGFPVQMNGKNLSTDDFAQLARKISKGKESEAEKKIMLNNHFEQDHDPVLESKIKEALEDRKRAEEQGKFPKNSEANQSPKIKEDIHQEALPSSEESKDSGNWKIPVILALLAFLAGLILIIRRK